MAGMLSKWEVNIVESVFQDIKPNVDARGRFGEHERSVKVARGIAKSNSSFLSALQTSQVHP